MTPTRNRLSVREGATPLPALREGVPPSLESALRGWIWETATLDSEVAQQMIRLDLVLPDAYWQRYQKELKERRAKQAALNAEWKAKQAARTEQDATAYLLSRPQPLPMPADPQARFLAYGTDTEILWDIVDDLLHELCIEPLRPGTPGLVVLRNWSATRRTKKITEPLRQLLEESRSVYEISPDQRGLKRRMDVFLAEQVERAAMSAEDAGYQQARVHLLRAQDKLYDLHPDPSHAYVEVILAVEAVACPLFLPADQLPTLGKVRGHLIAAGGKYEYVLADKTGALGSTDGIVAMLTDIWEGHSDRHAGGPLCVPVSQEGAEAAFSVAVTWSTSSARERCGPALSRCQGSRHRAPSRAARIPVGVGRAGRSSCSCMAPQSILRADTQGHSGPAEECRRRVHRVLKFTRCR